MFKEIWDKVGSINNHYAISKTELEFIISHAKNVPEGAVLLELGVCHGRTFAALSCVAMAKRGQAYGIDFFGLEGTPEEVRHSLDSRNITNYELIVSNTHTYPWDKPIDFLVIDAGHDEANVKPDIEKYVPFVKQGAYVFYDDYDDPFDSNSPHWAVRYYADIACKDWADLGIVEGVRGWMKPRVENE
jgi:hypothetical protein